jgi:hypothetical protein
MPESSITPPSELVEKWLATPEYISELKTMTLTTMTTNRLQVLLTEAASWGYQQALQSSPS